jgi:hypothetical protein
MSFSILHISDLHRDLSDEVDNPWLLESLAKDFQQYRVNDPEILRPTLCIVSGDLIYGVGQNAANATEEMERQYAQAEGFLIGLAERFFDGDRERIVILPGNHDVCYDDVMASAQRIEVPSSSDEKKRLTYELFKPHSHLRWSWSELCFYRIIDNEKYRNRFRYFAAIYENFYQGRRKFPPAPDQQYDVFDFSDLGFSIVALNSCYNNDPLRRAGAFHQTALTHALQALGRTERAGWLTAAAWHHNLTGGPAQDDYLDVELLQLLIDAGVSLGFHGHQHLSECIEERYRIGPKPRKMTIISAGTLCAGPHYLQPGIPRGYNIVELDTNAWRGRVHLRQMVNRINNLPVWGPGLFNITNSSYIDFELCQPLVGRPPHIDMQLELEQADKLIGFHQWPEAVDLLSGLKGVPLARPLLVKALSEWGDAPRTISLLWPPLTNTEIITVGGAILESGTRAEAEAFLGLECVAGNEDASVLDISQRIRERRLR